MTHLHVSASCLRLFHWELVHWKLQASLLSQTVTFNVSKKTGSLFFQRAPRQINNPFFFSSASELCANRVAIYLFCCDQSTRAGEKWKTKGTRGGIMKYCQAVLVSLNKLFFFFFLNDEKLVTCWLISAVHQPNEKTPTLGCRWV